MTIPTEPIGSIPRPVKLIEALLASDGADPALDDLYGRGDPRYDRSFRGDRVARRNGRRAAEIPQLLDVLCSRFAEHGSRRVPDSVRGGACATDAAVDVRAVRYLRYADSYVEIAQRYARVPVKQAVISPSALSLLYPADPLPDYSREEFIGDLLSEHEREVRACLENGAHCVQIDFTEARLAVKIDPSGGLLQSFIELNNLALSRFCDRDREKLGVHTCPGSDRDSKHSGDVDYADLLPSLFQLRATKFYVSIAGEADRERALRIVSQFRKPHQRVFVGVIDPTDPRIETPEEVRDRTLEAARYIPVDRLGTTDDCGFAPFYDDARRRVREDSRESRRHEDGGERIIRGERMTAEGEEDALLRSSAMKNAHSILAARDQAERALVDAKDELQRKSEELSTSLAMVRATLEATADAILVTCQERRVTGYNERFLRLWNLNAEWLATADHRTLLERLSEHYDDPTAFRRRVEEIIAGSPEVSTDELHLKDGRVIERVSRAQSVAGREIGRVWSFRDVTERNRGELVRNRLAAIVESSGRRDRQQNA